MVEDDQTARRSLHGSGERRHRSTNVVKNRRAFVVLVVATALLSPVGAIAQGPRAPYRIGYLRLGAGPLPARFWDAMRELGWLEGKNILVEPRYAMTTAELPDLADSLVRLNVDLMLTESIPATRAAMAATKSIPIVFTIGGDPVVTGLVASLARPGGNVTGYTLGLYDEKMLEMLKTALPRTKRVAVPIWGVYPGRVRAAAHELGMEIYGFELPPSDKVDHFFESARRTGADAVLIPNIPTFNNQILERLGREASDARLPAISWARTFALAGGLLSYGPVVGVQNISRTTVQIDRILKGAKPADLPVEQPTQFELVINLKTANALGLTIPPTLLNRADNVIR